MTLPSAQDTGDNPYKPGLQNDTALENTLSFSQCTVRRSVLLINLGIYFGVGVIALLVGVFVSIELMAGGIWLLFVGTLCSVCAVKSLSSKVPKWLVGTWLTTTLATNLVMIIGAILSDEIGPNLVFPLALSVLAVASVEW